jgi:hypothetical protein
MTPQLEKIMNSKFSILAAFVLAAVIAAFYGIVIRNTSIFGFDPSIAADSPMPILRIALTVAALVLGILFGSCHRIWRERKEPMNFSVVKAALLDADLWRSLLAAPIAFSGVYAAARTQPDYIVAFFFAFQSGFFSDAILQGKAANPTQQL